MKKKVKAKTKKKRPLGKCRLIARIVSIALALVVVACCAVGDWYKIQYANATGYMMKKFVRS